MQTEVEGHAEVVIEPRACRSNEVIAHLCVISCGSQRKRKARSHLSGNVIQNVLRVRGQAQQQANDDWENDALHFEFRRCAPKYETEEGSDSIRETAGKGNGKSLVVP